MEPLAAAGALSPGVCATLACLWEATAAKPGNVYRGADFDDLSYADFVASAAVIGPVMDRAADHGVGATVLAGVAATCRAVGVNTNLGMLLLMAPLAAVPANQSISGGIGRVLGSLTVQDAEQAYAAIRLAQPGGLGSAATADVNDARPPTITLREAMSLASDRDMIARQYVNDFAEVLATAERISQYASAWPLGEAIVQAYLELLAGHPDSLIARKCGPSMASEVSRRAADALEAIAAGPDARDAALADFDFWLRADGHRRNPGTSADLVAAALYVMLRERRVSWPVRFY
ncbi:MAG: triphosphoribosyl-dephospho-CoA synthase [Pirellulales bacterium]|nr:triphosphoribosyl-dephospho-CoA synthase [Pirellulales bacterium]